MDYSEKPRRTMNEALRTGRLNDEALAFVNGAAAKPATTQAPVSASATDTQPAAAGTVSMSFRLPAQLSARLIEVAVRRKLRHERPFSQQDIVAEALAAWLKGHGY